MGLTVSSQRDALSTVTELGGTANTRKMFVSESRPCGAVGGRVAAAAHRRLNRGWMEGWIGASGRANLSSISSMVMMFEGFADDAVALGRTGGGGVL